MRVQSLLATTCLGVLAAACATGEAQWSGTITDSAGVTIVNNTGDPLWPEGEGWTLVEELKIGSIDEDPEYQFGQIGWIEVTSDGQIFVTDAQAQHIKVFSPEGEYLQTIGGPGSGPGELGPGAVFLAMGAGDTLLVPDVQNRRVNRYGPDGTTLGSFALRIEDGIPMNWRATGTGLVAQQLRPLDLPNRPATDSMDVIVMLGTDGTMLDTLRRFESGQTFSFAGGAPEFKIYSPEPVWNLTPQEQLLFGVNDDYRIGIYDQAGALLRVLAMPFVQRPVSQRDQAAVIDFMEGLWKDAGVPPTVLNQLKANIHFGEYFPAFANVLPGPHHSVWVQHVQAASELSDEELESYNLLEDSGAPKWDVFDGDGRFLGNVIMPSRFTPRIIRGDKIYGVWRDDLDVPYVVRLGIAKGDS